MTTSVIERAIAKQGADAFLAAFTDEELAALAYEWEMWARPNQLAPAGDWFAWMVVAGRGFGKALALDTPVPTVSGWINMGEVQVGDLLFDENGESCRVTGVFDVQLGRPCYEVVFDDGSTIVADADHEWLTWDKAARKSAGRRIQRPPLRQLIPQTTARSFPGVRTTEQIKATLRVGKRGEVNHSVQVAGALILPGSPLPIDPYVLGLWLGDGDSKSAQLTVGDEDLTEILWHLAGRGMALGIAKQDARTGAWRVPMDAQQEIRGDDGRFVSPGGLHGRLKAEGLLQNKHIPAQYLRASFTQRLDLLMGLMDSDGHCQKGGHVEYSTTKPCLRDGAFELAVSLGFKPAVYEARAKLNGQDAGPVWRMSWTPQVPVFRLGRKVARQHSGKNQRERTRRRYIVDVRAVDSVPVRCIKVDSLSSLFLAGKSMIPTHNTRTGAEWIRRHAEAAPGIRMGVIAPTAGDARDIMVEGESGILAISPPGNYPLYEPSKRRLTWPNGARATVYSADEPDRFRGPQHHKVWADEMASWKYLEEAWDNIEMGLRLGNAPQACITTTPRPKKTIRDLLADESTVATRGSSYENRNNLSERFWERIIRRYEGTRLGRQELYAEILDDVEGALWQYAWIADSRVREAPDLARVVVGVDPAGTHGPDADETGIAVAGLGENGEYYVLRGTGHRLSPDGWGREVISAFDTWGADRIIPERNNGGDMVEATLRNIRRDIPITSIHASRGKRVRAEPVAALYEQKRVHHVGIHQTLEDQMIAFTGDPGDADDQVDALVYALSELSTPRRRYSYGIYSLEEE